MKAVYVLVVVLVAMVAMVSASSSSSSSSLGRLASLRATPSSSPLTANPSTSSSSANKASSVKRVSKTTTTATTASSISENDSQKVETEAEDVTKEGDSQQKDLDGKAVPKKELESLDEGVPSTPDASSVPPPAAGAASLDGKPEHPLPGTEEAEEVEPAHGDVAVRWPPRMPGTLPAAPPTADEIKSGARKAPYVCLTFDDGPNGATIPVADVVAAAGAKADFYLNCHYSQSALWDRTAHLIKLGMGVQSHMCDHATVRHPKTSKFAEYSWPSMKNYNAIYGNRKTNTPAAGNCFKGDDELRQTVLTNYGDTVRRYVGVFDEHGEKLPAEEMTLARMPGDGRFFKCLTEAIGSVRLADLGHANAVSPTPFHSGWQFECASNRIKWNHLPHLDHLGVSGVRCSEKSFPDSGDIILMHEAHWSSEESRASLGRWLKHLRANFFEIGRINPANGRCERW